MHLYKVLIILKIKCILLKSIMDKKSRFIIIKILINLLFNIINHPLKIMK